MVKWYGCSSYLLTFGILIFLISLGLFFASNLKPNMVSFRVLNFHN